MIERPGRLVEFGELLRLDVGRLGAERVAQRFQRRDRVLAPRGQALNLAAIGKNPDVSPTPSPS